MVEYKCDRCGKKLATEIKEGTKVTLYSVKSTEQGETRTFDLCSRCYHLVEQLINKEIKSYSDFCS
jgi:DNA-directed RNA polymerase subunit RPC12/RpoP